MVSEFGTWLSQWVEIEQTRAARENRTPCVIQNVQQIVVVLLLHESEQLMHMTII